MNKFNILLTVLIILLSGVGISSASSEVGTCVVGISSVCNDNNVKILPTYNDVKILPILLNNIILLDYI